MDGCVDPAEMDRGTPRRVLVCDDNEVLRHGLRAAFRQAPDLVIEAEATDFDEALTLAARLRPDVSVVGPGTREAVVHDLVRALTDTGTPVVLLGTTEDADGLVEALRAGARGWVHPRVSPAGLVESVRAVARGETVLDSSVAGALLHRLDAARPAGRGHGALTAGQLIVAELVAEGLSNAEIAARLRVSRATVKGHITVALRRLGLRDRTQLAIYVHRAGRPPERGGSRHRSG